VTGSLAHARAHLVLVQLADGRVLAAAGVEAYGAGVEATELWSTGAGSWSAGPDMESLSPVTPWKVWPSSSTARPGRRRWAH
jgi:hypothetical protein